MHVVRSATQIVEVLKLGQQNQNLESKFSLMNDICYGFHGGTPIRLHGGGGGGGGGYNVMCSEMSREYALSSMKCGGY